MKLLPGFTPVVTSCFAAAMFSVAGAQSLPGSLGFTIEGSFVNGTAQGVDSILITDNDLTNGYDPGFDLTDAPATLNPSGPDGSAAFQWGEAASWSDYPHTSSLWFQPLAAANIAPEQSFELGYLFYRNGTIVSGTGATSVDMAMTVSFHQPLGIDPVSVVFGSMLINTRNGSDPVASADVVSLTDLAAPLEFSNSNGYRYFLELTFQVDQNTIDGTLSTQDEFRVFEGGQGRATLLGRFTTTPVGVPSGELVPEPSAALLGGLGMLFLLRRKR